MKLLQNNSSYSIEISDIVNKLSEGLEALKTRSVQIDDFVSIEKSLRQLMRTIERDALGSLLVDYDVDRSHFYHEGTRYVRANRGPKNYLTAAGVITVERSLFRTERNSKTICPLELNAGIIEKFWTPQAAIHATHLVSLMTPAEAEETFVRLGQMTPSKSSLDRLPKALSKHIESQGEKLYGQLAESSPVPEHAVKMAVSIDGVLVPTRGNKVLSGDSAYTEASCGTVSYLDEAGEVISTRYFGRMYEYRKQTLKSQVTQLVEQSLQQRPILEVIKIADGARDNWEYLDKTLGHGQSVLDFYHASEHLFEAFESIYGKEHKKTYSEYQKYREILLSAPQGINRIISHLRYKLRDRKNNKKLKTELGYFTRNKSRCRYAEMKAVNNPIGSGIVEAACKSIVQLRLKRGGQHWYKEGGQAILNFRTMLKSGLFEKLWAQLITFYKTEKPYMANRPILVLN